VVCQSRRLRTPAVVDIKGSHEQQRGLTVVSEHRP